jgi:hypothetical protein
MDAVDDVIIVGLGELLRHVFSTGKRPGGAPANFAGTSGWSP